MHIQLHILFMTSNKESTETKRHNGQHLMVLFDKKHVLCIVEM